MDENLKAHFLNLYHMALCDVEFRESELVLLYSIGAEKGISKEDIDSIILSPNLVSFNIQNINVIERIEYLFDFAKIIWADKKIMDKEIELMKYFAKIFEFKKENIDAVVKFLLDEIKKGTSKEEVLKIVQENI